MIKKTLLSLGLLALASVAVFVLPLLLPAGDDGASAQAARANLPPPVVVARVAQAPFADSLAALGTVVANESVEITPV